MPRRAVHILLLPVLALNLLMFGELWLMDRLTIDEPDPELVHARKRPRQAAAGMAVQGKHGKKAGWSAHKAKHTG